MKNEVQGHDGVSAVTVTLPTALLTGIDEMIPASYSNRDEFIREAVRRYLEHLRVTKVSEAA